MEVKQGYKQTEVGLISEDWTVKRLEEVADIHSGGTPSTSQSHFWDGDILWCTPTDITALKGRKYLNDTARKISLQGLKSSSADLIPVNSLVMTSRATIGECAINQLPVSTNQGFKNFIHNKGTNTEFLYYLLQTKKQGLIRLCGGSTFLEIGKSQLNNFLVQWPSSKAEQEAIAEALSDVDALIESLEHLIEKKCLIKQGVMQELLTGKKRLPGFSEEWEMKRLGDISEMGSGGTPSTSVPVYYDGDIPWVSISDMTKGGKVILCTDRNLSTDGLSNSAAQMFPRGTVLYAMYASLGECSIAGIPLCSSQAILGIRPKESLDSVFLYYYLVSLKTTVASMGQQGTQSNLNKAMVQAFQIKLPKLSEQIAIAQVLSDMDTEIDVVEIKLAKVRQLKQGMMQNLLMGNIRFV